MTAMKRFGRLAAAFVLALSAAAVAEQGWAEEIRVDALNIPVTVSAASGSHSVELEAIVVRSDDKLSHPLAVLNHGSPRSANDRPMGHSAGGFATVALTADPPHDLAAAIGFAPGRGSTAPDAVCGERRLVSAFAQYGKTSRVPLLWVAAENDHFFGPRLVPLLTSAFSRAGGNVTLVKALAFGEDGHQLFSTASGIAIWSPIVDRFLAANNLVLREHPIEIALPSVAPPISLSSRGREAFKTFLESGPNKAFAITGDQRFGWATGRRTIEEAREEALRLCVSGKSAKCWVVNVNNKPVE